MLSDSAQLAMYGHLATKWERPTTFKAGAEDPHPVWLTSRTFLLDAFFIPSENTWDQHLAHGHMFHKNLLSSSHFMLLASPPHYHIREGGDPSNSVQRPNPASCSMLNAEMTQLAPQLYQR